MVTILDGSPGSLCDRGPNFVHDLLVRDVVELGNHTVGRCLYCDLWVQRPVEAPLRVPFVSFFVIEEELL